MLTTASRPPSSLLIALGELNAEPTVVALSTEAYSCVLLGLSAAALVCSGATVAVLLPLKSPHFSEINEWPSGATPEAGDVVPTPLTFNQQMDRASYFFMEPLYIH